MFLYFHLIARKIEAHKGEVPDRLMSSTRPDNAQRRRKFALAESMGCPSFLLSSLPCRCDADLVLQL
jgi:hypothetical protein